MLTYATISSSSHLNFELYSHKSMVAIAWSESLVTQFHGVAAGKLVCSVNVFGLFPKTTLSRCFGLCSTPACHSAWHLLLLCHFWPIFLRQCCYPSSKVPILRFVCSSPLCLSYGDLWLRFSLVHLSTLCPDEPGICPRW